MSEPHTPDDDEAEMKELLENWQSPEGDDETDSDDDDEDSISERPVEIPDGVVDHVVLACGDLDTGIQEFEKISGCSAIVTETTPSYVVKGLGIRCARVGFDTSYLEIIAPADDAPGPIGALIRQTGITKLTLFHYAIRYDLDQIETLVNDQYVTDRISLFGGNTKAGEPRKWDVIFLHGHTLAGMAPFFIHWRQPEFHPCSYLALNGSSWGNLTVTVPTDDPLHSFMENVGPVQGLKLQTGAAPHMSFTFTCPEGPVTFTASSVVGFKFPGLEDDEEDPVQAGDFKAPESPELVNVPDALPPTIESSL